MPKKEKLEQIVQRLVEVDMNRVLELIMANKELDIQRKAAMVRLADQSLHHLRLLRGAIEV